MFSTTVIAENKWYAWGNPHLGLDWEEEILEYSAALWVTDPDAGDAAFDTQCCIGFESEQCGIARKYLDNVGMPEDITLPYDDYDDDDPDSEPDDALKDLLPHLVNDKCRATRFSRKATRINDNRMKYEDKKKALVNLWAEQGWKLIFVLTVTEMRCKIKELKAKGE